MQTRYAQTGTSTRTPSRSGTRSTVRRAVTPPAAKTAELIFNQPLAQQVQVAGTFNDWDPSRTPLTRNSDGVWKATLSLAPGRYEYRFVVDGEWQADPKAAETVQNPFGDFNSVLSV